eukprot:CAMPEP_0196724360 /NCGR_PEP_ID=MMETSP1091-20130531/6244_1 /TAXON_ID=302021 /ORGANISM="Rhodomonas sp., Strain CCMP768" /LENGTH=337 /DNA_ID=CAMNT_0042066469 /DNA_START=147 /DNA_END=1160 /DNA_ORIENTATION=-
MQLRDGPARRDMLKLAVGAALFAAVQPVEASVFFDTEKYGDKELKVAAINKVKQQFRALYEKKPEMLPLMVRVAMTDCLTFDKSTGQGGGDGSIVKMADKYPDLKPALAEVVRIKDELQRQIEVSAADIIAFGGGVAIEATGGPRVIVQLGRTDGKKEQPPSGMAAWDQGDVIGALSRSGLGAKEAVLYAGMLGSMETAATAMTEAIKNKVECDASDPDCTSDEEGYYGLYSPVTIVSETKKEFGKNRGASAVNSNVGFDSARIAGLAGDAKFSNSYLVSLASGKAEDAVGKALLANKETKELVMEYGKKGNNRKFQKDAEQAFVALVELGRSNTSR